MSNKNRLKGIEKRLENIDKTLQNKNKVKWEKITSIVTIILATLAVYVSLVSFNQAAENAAPTIITKIDNVVASDANCVPYIGNLTRINLYFINLGTTPAYADMEVLSFNAFVDSARDDLKTNQVANSFHFSFNVFPSKSDKNNNFPFYIRPSGNDARELGYKIHLSYDKVIYKWHLFPKRVTISEDIVQCAYKRDKESGIFIITHPQ